MKFCYPEINKTFDTSRSVVDTVIIENQHLLFSLIKDIKEQIEGNDGKAVLSQNDKILPISNNLECLSEFIPFDLNKRVLVNKANALLEQIALQSDNYESTMQLLSSIEAFLLNTSFEMPGDIAFSKVNLTTLIKAVGLEFVDEYDSLAEKIIDYMELVREYERDKLFITVNLRSYIDDSEMDKFMKTVLQHQIHLIMIENREYERLPDEDRYIIDTGLCEIS